MPTTNDFTFSGVAAYDGTQTYNGSLLVIGGGIVVAPIGWNTGAKREDCAWASLDPFDGIQPATIDDLSIQDIEVRDEYPAWCVDDWYAPSLHGGDPGAVGQGQAPIPSPRPPTTGILDYSGVASYNGAQTFNGILTIS